MHNWPHYQTYSPYYTTSITSSSTTMPLVLTAHVQQSVGHVPDYNPPSLAEDELAWLSRRITEVTDLCPAA